MAALLFMSCASTPNTQAPVDVDTPVSLEAGKVVEKRVIVDGEPVNIIVAGPYNQLGKGLETASLFILPAGVTQLAAYDFMSKQWVDTVVAGINAADFDVAVIQPGTDVGVLAACELLLTGADQESCARYGLSKFEQAYETAAAARDATGVHVVWVGGLPEVASGGLQSGSIVQTVLESVARKWGHSVVDPSDFLGTEGATWFADGDGIRQWRDNEGDLCPRGVAQLTWRTIAATFDDFAEFEDGAWATHEDGFGGYSTDCNNTLQDAPT